MMKERIIAEIKRQVSETGVVPGVLKFTHESTIPRKEWEGKIWARWSDALKDAGFESNMMTVKLSSEEILKKIAQCCLDFGKIPSGRDMRIYGKNKIGFPADKTIRNHFRSNKGLRSALRDWASLPNNADYAEIVALLPSESATSESATPKVNLSAKIDGHVYLIKAGDYYKIGRSDELERRVKEIRIALPQAAILEHTIATDDPPGIEAYWHRRFADRRANGEWFKLSKADVLAFKKRKFQ